MDNPLQPSQQCQMTIAKVNSGFQWRDLIIDGILLPCLKTAKLETNHGNDGCYTKSWGQICLTFECDRIDPEPLQWNILPGVHSYQIDGVIVHGQLLDVTPLENSSKARVTINQYLLHWSSDEQADGSYILSWGVGPHEAPYRVVPEYQVESVAEGLMLR